MKHPVVLKQCESYEEDTVCQAVKTLLEGLEAENRVNRGERILLKPNLLAADPLSSGTCPHPIVVYAIAKWLKERGAKLLLSDSAGFGSARGAARTSGIMEVTDRLGIPVVEMRETIRKERDFSPSQMPRFFTMAKLLDEVDGVVNLPKLKAHSQLLLSISVKNLYGLVPGKRKAWRHLVHGKNVETFSDMLVTHAHLVGPKIRFTVLDAIDAMEGKGPRGGAVRRVGVLAAGQDPFSLDAVVCDMIGINPMNLPTVASSVRAGFLDADMSQIPLLGDELDMLRVKDFKLPKHLIPVNFSPLRILQSTYRHLRVLFQQWTSES